MLDKELNKITDFYVSKGPYRPPSLPADDNFINEIVVGPAEKELLEDLVYLEEDLEKFRDGHYSDMDFEEDHRGRATSGASDSEDEDHGDGDDDGDEENTPKGDRSGFSKVLTDPREYDAAIRAGRKTLRPANDRKISGESLQRKSRGKAASKRSISKDQNGHSRRKSTTSETGDLLGMEDEDDEAEGGFEADRSDRRRRSSASEALSGSGRRPSYVPHASDTVLQGGQTLRKYRSGGKVRDVAARLSASFLAEEEDEFGATGASDWAIDTKIMYKRRLAALFTVSQTSTTPLS